jgi:hypothetical protein
MINARTGMTQISDNNSLIAHLPSHVWIMGLINTDDVCEDWINHRECCVLSSYSNN